MTQYLEWVWQASDAVSYIVTGGGVLPVWAPMMFMVVLVVQVYFGLLRRPSQPRKPRVKRKKEDPGGQAAVVMVPSSVYNPNTEECDRLMRSMVASREPFAVIINGYQGNSPNDIGKQQHQVIGSKRMIESLTASEIQFDRVPLPDTESANGSKRWYGQMKLEEEDCFSLHDPTLTPDPISGLSTFYTTLDQDHEQVNVGFLCWPLPPERMRNHRNQQMKQLDKGGLAIDMKDNNKVKALRQQMEESMRADSVALRVIIAADAQTSRRAQEMVEAASAQLAVYNGANQWLLDARRRRQKKLNNWWHEGAVKSVMPSTPWIPIGWIRGILKPATMKCGGQPLRMAPVAGRPPPMPYFSPSDPPSMEYIPWGIDLREKSENGEQRVLAVKEKETFFTWTGGSAGFGKSETSLSRFVYLARAGHGCLFLDPHAHGSEAAKPYLAEVADRVVELALDGSGTNLVAWNPFDVKYVPGDGTSEEQWEKEVASTSQMICDMFFGFRGWSGAGADNVPRARIIFGHAVNTLMGIVPKLHRADRPTLFTIADLLEEDEFRESILPHVVDKRALKYWVDTYPNETGNPAMPITRPLLEFYNQRLVKALLGASATGFRISDLIDQRKVVLVRIGGGEELMRLIASLLFFDVMDAMMSRRDRRPEDCPPFHMFLDEVPVYDSALRGQLAAAMEQCRKFGLRVHLLSQSAMRLDGSTREALATNRTHLCTSSSGPKTAKWMADVTGGTIRSETVSGLKKYEFVSEITLNGQKPPPFNMGGLEMRSLFGDPPDVPHLQEQIDKNSQLRNVAKTVDELETLPERITAALASIPAVSSGAAGAMDGPPDEFGDVFDSPDANADEWGKLINSVTDVTFEG